MSSSGSWPATLGIAIPSLGNARYVTETLASVRRVSIPFEAVIQDGGSDEGTIEAIQASIAGDDRFQLVVESDEGQSDAINRAFRRLMPRHRFVTWVNTDDVVHPHGVAAALSAIAGDDRAVACFGDYIVIDVHGLIVDFVRPPRRINRWRLLYGWNVVPGVATIIRSSALEQVGLLDERLNYAMDYDLWVRLCGIGRFINVHQPVFSFREHAGSKTTSGVDRSLAEEAQVAAAYRRLPAWLTPPVVRATRASLVAQRALGNRSFVQRSSRSGAHVSPS